MAITARELLVTLGFKTDKAGAQQAESGLQRIEKAARAVGAIFVTGAVATGFKKLVDLASDAAESANKFQAVFTDAAGSVSSQLDDIAKRTGSSTLELKDFAGNIGALIKPALGSSEAAGAMSASVAELALDIASFNNLKPDEALIKLRSGLIGSAEPLQGVGIDIRQNQIGMEEYAESIGKTAKELTEGQKIQLRYNAILRQLKEQGALGDAERTSRDLANASRNLQLRMKEVGALIGGFFLESAKESTLSMFDLAGSVMDFLKANKEVIQLGVDKALASIARVTRFLSDTVTLLWKAWDSLTDSMSENGAMMANLILGLGVLIALLGLPTVLLLALSAAIWLVVDDFQAWQEGGQSVIGTLVEGFKQLLEDFGGWPGAIKEFLQTAWDYWIVFFSDMFGFGTDTVEGLKGAFRELTNFIVDSFQAALGIVGDLFGAVGKAFEGDFKGAFKGVQNAATRGLGVALDFADKVTGNELFGGNVQQVIQEGIEAEEQEEQRARRPAPVPGRPTPQARPAGVEAPTPEQRAAAARIPPERRPAARRAARPRPPTIPTRRERPLRPTTNPVANRVRENVRRRDAEVIRLEDRRRRAQTPATPAAPVTNVNVEAASSPAPNVNVKVPPQQRERRQRPQIVARETVERVRAQRETAKRAVATGAQRQEQVQRARPAPQMAMAAQGQRGGTANVNTTATINVTPGPGQNAREVGKGAADRLDELRARQERRAAAFAFGTGAP